MPFPPLYPHTLAIVIIRKSRHHSGNGHAAASGVAEDGRNNDVAKKKKKKQRKKKNGEDRLKRDREIHIMDLHSAYANDLDGLDWEASMIVTQCGASNRKPFLHSRAIEQSRKGSSFHSKTFQAQGIPPRKPSS